MLKSCSNLELSVCNLNLVVGQCISTELFSVCDYLQVQWWHTMYFECSIKGKPYEQFQNCYESLIRLSENRTKITTCKEKRTRQIRDIPLELSKIINYCLNPLKVFAWLQT